MDKTFEVSISMPDDVEEWDIESAIENALEELGCTVDSIDVS